MLALKVIKKEALSNNSKDYQLSNVDSTVHSSSSSFRHSSVYSIPVYRTSRVWKLHVPVIFVLSYYCQQSRSTRCQKGLHLCHKYSEIPTLNFNQTQIFSFTSKKGTRNYQQISNSQENKHHKLINDSPIPSSINILTQHRHPLLHQPYIHHHVKGFCLLASLLHCGLGHHSDLRRHQRSRIGSTKEAAGTSDENSDSSGGLALVMRAKQSPLRGTKGRYVSLGLWPCLGILAYFSAMERR